MTFDEFAEKYNILLNEQQKEAAQTVDGPCLLLAVPGSGKTTVLVTRLGYMIYGCGIAPESILTLTYTVSATKDMSERYVKIFGNEHERQLEFRTINGVCARILIWYSSRIGRSSFDLESDEGQKIKRITRIYQDLTHQYPAESDIQEISTYITYIKNMMLEDEEIDKLGNDCEYPLRDIYNAYNRSLKTDQMMDYDDQMIYAYKILMSDPVALDYFRNKYRYICVDEAQDTSKIQHAIISLLAGKNGNLFMVGDEDQSIYGFRAAFPEALLDFEDEHPGAKILLMEENFRSNANIVSAADAFIQKNTMRHKKTLRAHRESGSTIEEIKVNDRYGQHKYLLEVARNCTEETAVLYRDNESVIPFIDLLDREGISFRVRNEELSFFSNKVVQDIVSILKFALDQRDAESFLKIYYKLGIYMTKEDAFRLVNMANGSSITDVGRKCKFMNKNTFQNFIDFCNDINHLKTVSPVYAIGYIENNMGYGRYLHSRHISSGKLEILRMIFRNVSRLDDALTRLDELKTIITNNFYDNDCKLVLSTIHSSKGLEYKNVYIIDVIDGVFPDKTYDNVYQLSKDERAVYEESRRVFYVGITRAKDNLFLFRTGAAATFINETHKQIHRSIDFNAHKKNKDIEDFAIYCDRFKEGGDVKHFKYGIGVIVAVKAPIVEIKFKKDIKKCDMKILYESNAIKFIL